MTDLSSLEYHLLLALEAGPSYGYALLGLVEDQSSGRLEPDIGSLYRALGRFMDRGWVEEADAPEAAPERHRGRPRRYYRLAPAGLDALREETARLADLVALAAARNLAPESGA